MFQYLRKLDNLKILSSVFLLRGFPHLYIRVIKYAVNKLHIGSHLGHKYVRIDPAVTPSITTTLAELQQCIIPEKVRMVFGIINQVLVFVNTFSEELFTECPCKDTSTEGMQSGRHNEVCPQSSPRTINHIFFSVVEIASFRWNFHRGLNEEDSIYSIPADCCGFIRTQNSTGAPVLIDLKRWV